MKRIVTLTESDLMKIVKRVLNESGVVNNDNTYTLDADYTLNKKKDFIDPMPDTITVKKGTKVILKYGVDYNTFFTLEGIEIVNPDKTTEMGSMWSGCDNRTTFRLSSEKNTTDYDGGALLKNLKKLFCDGDRLKSFEDVKKTYDFLHAKPPYIKNLYGGIYNVTPENKSEIEKTMSSILGQSVEVDNMDEIKESGYVMFGLKGGDIWVYIEYDKPNDAACRGCRFERNYNKNGVNYQWNDLGDKSIHNKNYDKQYDYYKTVVNGITKYYVGRKDNQTIKPSSQTYGSTKDWYMAEIKPDTNTYKLVKSKVFKD